jgi:hypothetical protein
LREHPAKYVYMKAFELVIFLAALTLSCNEGANAPDTSWKKEAIASVDSLKISSPDSNYHIDILEEDRFRNEQFDINPIEDDFGKRYYMRSDRYEIIVRYHKNGAKYIEHIDDRVKRVKEIKEYYESGRLKEEGTITLPYQHFVGKRVYYSSEGKVDSVIDYDRKKALDIAQKAGFDRPDIDVDLKTIHHRTYWVMIKWKRIGQVDKVIVIDTYTGQVSIPDQKLLELE